MSWTGLPPPPLLSLKRAVGVADRMILNLFLRKSFYCPLSNATGRIPIFIPPTQYQGYNEFALWISN